MGAEQLRVEDRILIHLQNYIKFADDYEVPKAMSQKGIGEAVWIAWSNVPRAMKRLVSEGLVDERTARVKGEFRKKKVYLVTPQGFARAKELREELGQRLVVVKSGGTTREMSFADVPEFVRFKVPFLELLRGIDDDGVLDVERAQTRWEEQVEMVDRTQRAPKLRTFVGREHELETLGTMAQEHRIVVLHGIAGIGKTSLAVRLLDELRSSTNVLWVTLHTWDTLAGVLAQLANFLADTGRRQLRSLLDDLATPELEDIYYPLEQDLKDLKGVIVIDDFHKASDGVVDLATMFLELLRESPSLTLLLVSRYLPSFYDRRYVVVQRLVGELQLQGLDRAAARTLLEGRGLKDQEFDHIYATTQGHPLALELVMQRRRPEATPFADVMAFVREEVFEGLTEAERCTLSALSVHRGGVPRDAALNVAASVGGGTQVLDSLEDRGLVAELGEAEVRLHDLVREFFSSRLSPEEREALHRDAAEAWGRISSPEATLERAYHLQQAGEAEAAVATLAASSRGVLMEPRLLRDVMAVLDSAMARGTLSPPVADEAEVLRADALSQLDQVDAAHTMYTRLLDRAVAEGEARQEARLLHRIGLLHARRGQDQEALGVQRRAIEAFERDGDEAGVAQCRLAIADILSRREELDAAVEELGMAHGSFTMVEDRHGIALACTRLASIMLDKEDTSVARSYLEEALDNLDPKEDAGTLSHTYYLLGEVDRLEEEWQQAVEHYEGALELFQLLGDEQMVANACTYLGDAYQALGDEEQASMYYQRGMDLMVSQ